MRDQRNSRSQDLFSHADSLHDSFSQSLFSVSPSVPLQASKDAQAAVEAKRAADTLLAERTVTNAALVQEMDKDKDGNVTGSEIEQHVHEMSRRLKAAAKKGADQQVASAAKQANLEAKIVGLQKDLKSANAQQDSTNSIVAELKQKLQEAQQKQAKTDALLAERTVTDATLVQKMDADNDGTVTGSEVEQHVLKMQQATAEDQAKIADLSSQIVSLKDSLKKAGDQQAASNSKQAETNDVLAELQKKLKEAQQKQAETDALLAERTVSNAALIQKMDADSDGTVTGSEVTMFVLEMQQATERDQAKIADLTGEVVSLKDSLKTAGDQQAASNSKQAETNDVLAELQKKLAEAQQKQASSDTKQAETDAVVTTLTQQLADANGNQSNTDAVVATLTQQLADAQQQQAASNTKQAETDAVVATLTQQLADAQQQQAASDTKQAESDAVVATLTQQLTDKTQLLSAAEQKQAETDALLADRTVTNAALVQKMDKDNDGTVSASEIEQHVKDLEEATAEDKAIIEGLESAQNKLEKKLNKAAEKQAATDATVASLEEEVQEGQESIVILLKGAEDKLALHRQEAQAEKEGLELKLAESIETMTNQMRESSSDSDTKFAQEQARATAELQALEISLKKEAADMKAICELKEAQLAQEGEDLRKQMALEKAQADALMAQEHADAEATMTANKARFEGEMKAQETRLMKEAADMKAAADVQAAEMRAAEAELNGKIKEAADFLAEQQAEAARNAELIAVSSDAWH